MAKKLKLLKDHLKKSKQAEPENLVSSDDEDDEIPEYEVDKIVRKRLKNGKAQYLLKWKNYPASENTWEPEENVNDPNMIIDFEKKNAKLAEKSSKKAEKTSASSASKASGTYISPSKTSTAISSPSKNAETSSASSMITLSSSTTDLSQIPSSWKGTGSSSTTTSDKSETASSSLEKGTPPRKRILIESESSDNDEALQKFKQKESQNQEIEVGGNLKFGDKVKKFTKKKGKGKELNVKNAKILQKDFDFDSDSGASTGFVVAAVEVDDDDDETVDKKANGDKSRKDGDFLIKLDEKGGKLKDLKISQKQIRAFVNGKKGKPKIVGMIRNGKNILVSIQETDKETIRWISNEEARSVYPLSLLDYYEQRIVWSKE